MTDYEEAPFRVSNVTKEQVERLRKGMEDRVKLGRPRAGRGGGKGNTAGDTEMKLMWEDFMNSKERGEPKAQEGFRHFQQNSMFWKGYRVPPETMDVYEAIQDNGRGPWEELQPGWSLK